jgi:polysaccharide deacetylase 2 family uncharacterized protein YibQ
VQEAAVVGKFLLGMVSGGLLVTGGLVVASILAPTRPSNENAPVVAVEEPIAAPAATDPEAGETAAEPEPVAEAPEPEPAKPATEEVAVAEPELAPTVAPAVSDEAPAAPEEDAAVIAPAPEAPAAEIAKPETVAEPSKPATAEADTAATPDPVAPAPATATAEAEAADTKVAAAEPVETNLADAGESTKTAHAEPAAVAEPAPALAETEASAGTTETEASAAEPAPAEPAPVETAAVDPAPAATPVEPTPTEPAPAEPAPAETVATEPAQAPATEPALPNETAPAVTEAATEAPAAQTPAVEAPDPEVVAEPVPTVEAPVAAAPDAEAPVVETPIGEAPTADPATETTPMDPVATELPAGDAPTADGLAIDDPVAEADSIPAPAGTSPEADVIDMPGTKPATLPGVTEPAEAPATAVAEEEGAKTFKPAPGLIRAGEGTIIGRDEPDETAATDPAAPPEDPRPIAQFATAFENPDAKPPFAIVLVDPGTPDLDRAGLAALPFPVSFALDPLDPATPQRAATYRAAGREVVMLVTGIADGAQASDIEVAFQSMEQGLPEAVAAMDLADPTFQNNRALSSTVVPILKAQGRGLLTWDEGLNAADQVARRDDLESAVVFRNLDQGGGDKVAVRRLLDRAVFKADQDGRVSVVATADPSTVAALLEWTVEGKAATVALAPLSAVLQVD